MITIIIGHRSSGKKSLLQRVQWYLREEKVSFFILDDFMEGKLGHSIQSLFTEHGEAYFRKLEKQFFLELLQKTNEKAFIVVSPGFDLNIIPSTCQILWVQRKTDKDGRILLGRPVIYRKIQSLQDFHLRAEERNFNFSKKSNWIYEVPEGDLTNSHQAMEIEKEILFEQTPLRGYFEVSHWGNSSWERFKGREVSFVFDLKGFSSDSFTLFKKLIHFEFAEKIVLRISDQDSLDLWTRNFEEFQNLLKSFNEVHFSVDLKIDFKTKSELARFSESMALVLCVTMNDLSQLKSFQEMAQQINAHLYCEFLSDSLTDVLKLMDWRSKESALRSIAVKSTTVDWDWIILTLKYQQKINYWREGFFGVKSGPSLFEWVMVKNQKTWCGVSLGDPVYSQPTIVDFLDMSNSVNGYFVQANIKKSDYNISVDYFKEMGVRFFDIQSPLTDVGKDTCFIDQQGKEHFISIESEVIAEFLSGLRYLVDFESEIVFWTHRERLPIYEKHFRNAIYFSARTGERRKGNPNELIRPSLLVWDPHRSPEVQLPPEDWRPLLVLDLTVQDHSMAREYADGINCSYIGGQEFFKKRSLSQLLFWKKHSL